MSYDELVKALRNNADHYVFTGDNGLVHLLTNAADAIERLEKKVTEWQEEACKWNNEYFSLRDSMPRWISVMERLPDSAQNILVTDGKCVGMGWLDTYVRKDTGKVINDWFAPNTAVVENKITYWMYLPEPPKEDEA